MKTSQVPLIPRFRRKRKRLPSTARYRISQSDGTSDFTKEYDLEVRQQQQDV